jgi:hypothetical protein
MANNLRHEWILYINFKDSKTQQLFLSRIRFLIRDYWYKQRAEDYYKKLKVDNIKIPISGMLQVYITEVKNLCIAKLNMMLYNNSKVKLLKSIIRVKLCLNSQKNEESIYLSSSRAEEVVEGELKEEFLWSTEEQPAGSLINLGRFMTIPNNNITLKITVTVPIIKEGIEEAYELGSAEYS